MAICYVALAAVVICRSFVATRLQRTYESKKSFIVSGVRRSMTLPPSPPFFLFMRRTHSTRAACLTSLQLCFYWNDNKSFTIPKQCTKEHLSLTGHDEREGIPNHARIAFLLFLECSAGLQGLWITAGNARKAKTFKIGCKSCFRKAVSAGDLHVQSASKLYEPQDLRKMRFL